MFILESTIAAAEEIREIKGIVGALADMLLLPDVLIKIILTAIIIILAKVFSLLATRFFRNLSERKPNFTALMATMLGRICSVVIWIVAVLFGLATWGIDLGPVIAGLGVTGIVLGFALQESISSLFSGFMIAINDPFRVGDWIEIGQDGVAGIVKSMDLLCVTLATADNKKYTVSNKYVWGNTILNASYTERRRIDIIVQIGYDMDTDKAKKVLRSLVESYPEVLKDPVPVVEVGAFGDSSINIYVRPWVKPSDYWMIYWRFNGDVLKVLRENGLNKPYNRLVVQLNNEEK